MEIKISRIEYSVNGNSFSALKVSDGDLEMLNLTACNCQPPNNEEKCINGRLYRCMASGGGTCAWYLTDEYC